MAADDEHEADRRQIQVFISTVAAMLTEAARDRAERQRQLAGDLREQARLLEAQYATERAAAQALWAPALTDEWWARASIADVQAAYRASAEWEEVDQGARSVAVRIRERASWGSSQADNEDPIPSTTSSSSLEQPVAAGQRNVAFDTRERRIATADTLTRAAKAAGATSDAAREAVEAHMLVDLSNGMGAESGPMSKTARRSSNRGRIMQHPEPRRRLHR